MSKLLRTSTLTLLLTGSLAITPASAQPQPQPNDPQTQPSNNPLTPYLQNFPQTFTQELNLLLKYFSEGNQNSPITQDILNGLTEILGALGVPIPSSLQGLSTSISQKVTPILSQPAGDTKAQTDYVSANAIVNQVSDGIIGQNGQTKIKQLLEDSENAWNKARESIDNDLSNNASKVADEADSIQDTDSTLEAIKGIARQNALLAQIHQNFSSSTISMGEIGAMSLNMGAKQIMLGAGQLQSQQLASNAVTNLNGSTIAQHAGASNFFNNNALTFACLSVTDCSKGGQ